MELYFVRNGELTKNTDKLTKTGREQATLTGKYLKKYGRFDAIYSGPVENCIETAEIITKAIGSNDQIIESDLLIGCGGIKEPRYDMNNEKIKKLSHKISYELKHEHNLIKLFVSHAENEKKFDSYTGIRPTHDELKENCQMFLNMLKNLKKKRILCIAGASTIECMIRICTNINIYNQLIKIIPSRAPNQCQCPETPYCSITGFLLESGNFTLVFALEIRHLETSKQKGGSLQYRSYHSNKQAYKKLNK